jgi:hypothetical protein
MTPSRKKIIAFVGTVLVFAIWLGATIAGSVLAESKLKEWAAHSGKPSGLRIVNLQHDRGYFASSGRFDLQLHDGCGSDSSDDRSAQVEYRLDHRVLPTGLMRFEWRLAFTGGDGSRTTGGGGLGAPLEGKGRLSYGGTAYSSFALPDLAVREANALTQLSGFKGHAAIGSDTLGISGKAERMVARGNGKALELRQIDFSLDLRDRHRGVGTFSFGIDGIATRKGSAEGLRFVVDATEREDRIDVKVSPALRSVQMPGATARDLALEISLKDLHAESAGTIHRIAGDTCMLKNMTADEDRQVREALRALLLNGLSVGLSKISGTVASGQLDGELRIALDKGKEGEALELARRLKASGRLAVKGKALSDDQKSMIVALGFATESPEGLMASFDYADGFARVNGRAFDAGDVQRALSSMERTLEARLSTAQRR